MMLNARERGQTLPLWTAAILASLVLMFFAINYGNVLRWQVRVQNDADAAASALVSLQTETWNQQTEVLYASAVEEYRIRKQLDNLNDIIHNAGGCYTATGTNGCQTAWGILFPYFQAAVSRYTTDVTVLNSILHNTTFYNMYDTANPSSDAGKLIAKLNRQAPNCMQAGTFSPDFGDCSAFYTLVATQRRTGLENVTHGAFAFVVPHPGSVTATTGSTSGTHSCCDTGTQYYNSDLYSPVAVEVAVCAIVPPVIPSFFVLQAPAYTAIGRGAATAVQVEQDWLQPGEYTEYLSNGTSPGSYQRPESYGSSNGLASSYDLNYGGSAYTAFPSLGGFAAGSLTGNDFEGFVAWWAPIPVAPFSGVQTLAAVGAGSASSCAGNRTAP